MAKINAGRFAADTGADGKVLFLIGMRFNQLWKVWKWIPVLTAMPRMLIELQKNPSLGLVGKPRRLVWLEIWMINRLWNPIEA